MRKIKGVVKKELTRFKDFMFKVLEILKRPEMAILPGQLAFFSFLSFVPIITFISVVASVVGLSMDNINTILNNVFPSMKLNITMASLDPSHITLGLIIILVVMFYIASNGANSIILTSNEIYGIKQSSFISRRIKAILMTVLFVILYLFILLVPLLGTKILNSTNYFGLKDHILPLIPFVRGPITWLVIFAFIRLIYLIAPDRLLPNARVYVGSLFTTIGWIVSTSIYSAFLNNHNNYNIYYGGLSSIASLMLWVYILSFIFVMGMSLNYSVEKEKLEKTGIII